ncbi:MAG TPA: helix-turn-helix domain-containing protein [Steroidobacteraceae bacterium]|nr:helix-turn-helix domain-containing protein [Steroidobacteraceae bacterium]
MKDGPNIARIAALLGDPARAEALTALMADRALTATELSAIAGVSKQTMSAHLAKLLDARLVAVDPLGRHRYYRLAGADVAELLESLMGVALRTGAVRLVSSPREPALRRARICYDHLAGELGVLAFEALLQAGVLLRAPEGLRLTPAGGRWFATLNIDAGELGGRRRTLCRPCMDWSERRQHLAGALGSQLLKRILDTGWARRERLSRVIRFTPEGEREFRRLVAGAAGFVATSLAMDIELAP